MQSLRHERVTTGLVPPYALVVPPLLMEMTIRVGVLWQIKLSLVRRSPLVTLPRKVKAELVGTSLR